MATVRLQARACGMRGLGSSQPAIDNMWRAHHGWAGDRLYSLCTELRGFYLKACLQPALVLALAPVNWMLWLQAEWF